MSLGRLPYREPASELAAAVDRFLAVRDLMPTSRRSYRQVLTAVANAAGPTRPVGDLAAGELAAALTESYGTAAAATWNRAATIVRGFAGWCAEQGWTEEDQLPRLAKLTRRRRPRPSADRVLPVEVIDGLCRRPDVPLREKTLWRLAYETAGRAEELLGLNIEDLDLANKRARITGKGGAVEVLHFQSGSARLLPRLIGRRRRGPLFLTSRTPQTGRAPAAPDACPHTGRARLSYRRAAELFTAHTGGATLHQLRHSAL